MASDSRLFTNIKDGPRRISSLPVSWEMGPSSATAKVNLPGLAVSCQLPLAVDDWGLVKYVKPASTASC